MPLERERFLVYVQDENEAVTTHQVTVSHQDMLRGELEHDRAGAPDKAKMNLVTAWCWAGLVRMGVYTKSFQHFRDMECMGLEDDGKETVDPTQPGTTSDSASS